MIDELYDALDIAAKAYPIKALASEIKGHLGAVRAESTLRNELNRQPGYKLGILTAVQIMEKTGDLSALDLIESHFNRVPLHIPAIPTDGFEVVGVVKAMAHLSKEFGEAISELAVSMEDGHLSIDEQQRCIKETDDLIRAAVRMKGTLERTPMAKPPWPHKVQRVK